MSDASLARETSAVLKKHARSFRWGAVFLSRKQHEQAAILYAFCREVDDAVDEAPSVQKGREALEEIEAMLDERRPRSPLVQAYVQLCDEIGVGLTPARDLIAGARSDLGLVQMQSDQELRQYCYRVAGTVGLMMCGVLGVTAPAARRNAIELGIAMQLTNISRDVLEDARLGRVYLPRRRLEAAGITPSDLLLYPGERETPTADDEELRTFNKDFVRRAVSRVTKELLSEADVSYYVGEAGYRYIPTRARLAISVAARLYRAIGQRLLRHHDADPLHGRTIVPPSEKLILVARSLVSWARSTLTPSRRLSATHHTLSRLPAHAEPAHSPSLHAPSASAAP